jgi:hypothetical protein
MTRAARSPSAWALAAALALLLTGAPAARAGEDQGASWQFAPAQAPPPPTGAEPSQFPTALGRVGDIAFWSPNRGLLITAGNSFVPAGLYAYDGESWHQLSSVCGATDGRIAWAGPDEFWTISDQRAGQLGVASDALWDVSLCHFENGQVVGSYALPVGQPDSYRPMDAAACDGPDDCWFGGTLGEGSDSGAFHLYWNGSALNVVYSPQDHAVASMVAADGQIYESVQLAPGDSYGDESTSTPPVLHTIEPSDPEQIFHEVFPVEATCTLFCPPLPDYGTNASGEEVAPDTLAGLALSSDWSLSGEQPASPQLWAVAGPDGTPPPAGDGEAHPVALRYVNEEWTQIVPNLTAFAPGEDPQGVAADPGEQAAWITMQSNDGVAYTDLLSSTDGGASWTVAERDALGPEQGVGPRGEAGPIACPAAHECWLATSQGWLFHLTDGSSRPRDTDPFFDGEDGVITYRPPDAGVPVAPPDQPPEEPTQPASGEPPLTPVPSVSPRPVTKPGEALVSRIHTRVLRGDVLALTFTLARTAHVQLLASRHGRVVARSRRETLRKGSHTLELRLDPRSWPTKLELHATTAAPA